MHSLVTYCLSLLLRSFLPPTASAERKKKFQWIRLVATLAFASHPIHCEAVASIVGRAELGYTLHTLLALLAYRNHLNARSNGQCPQSTSSSNSSVGLAQQLIGRVVSTICCFSSSSSSSSSSSRLVVRHQQHLSSSSSSSSSHRRGGGMLYLMAASFLALTAILWKETGIMALPLCAILELTSSSSSSLASSASSSNIQVTTFQSRISFS